MCASHSNTPLLLESYSLGDYGHGLRAGANRPRFACGRKSQQPPKQCNVAVWQDNLYLTLPILQLLTFEIKVSYDLATVSNRLSRTSNIWRNVDERQRHPGVVAGRTHQTGN